MDSIRYVEPSTAEYAKDYRNGWATGERGAEGALERADARNVSHAWYDGYMDAAAGRDMWTWRETRLGGFHTPEDYYAAQDAAQAAPAKQPGCLCMDPAKPSPLCPVCDPVTAANVGRQELGRATTGDDVLTALYAMRATSEDDRRESLAVVPVKLLRAAADLCGVDSEDMTKRAAIRAIVENF